MSILYSLFAALRDVIVIALELYVWILIVGAVLSWLVAFEVVNVRNRFVAAVGDFCHRLTAPALRPLRRFVPVFSGIDLSPVILIFIIIFLQSFLVRL